MLIRTQRLSIRPIVESDWQSVQAIWNSLRDSVYAQYDKPHPTEDAQVRARVNRWAGFIDTLEHMFFAVCLQERVIGYIACNQREVGHEIGYSFHADFHGRGYAKESLQALMAHLRSLGIAKLKAGTALANVPSMALLKSLGFQLVGQEKVSFYQDDEGNDIVFDGGILERNLTD